MKNSDDYLRLEEAERICNEAKEDVFTDGERVSMQAFSGKWTGYPNRSQVAHFISLMRRTELENDGLYFEKLYQSLEAMCNRLKKRGVKEALGFLKTIEVMRNVSEENLRQSMLMGYVVNGKKLDPNEIIENQVYGEVLHTDLGKVRKKKESKAAEDIAFFYAMTKYMGHYVQLQNVVRLFDALKPHIESVETGAVSTS